LHMLSRISVSRLSKPIQITALVVLAIAQITLSKDTISSPYGIFALCILAFLGYMALKVSIENPIDRQIDYLKQYMKWTNDTQQDFDEKKKSGSENEKNVYSLLIHELDIRIKTLQNALTNANEQKNKSKV
jgi:hypothetical protein